MSRIPRMRVCLAGVANPSIPLSLAVSFFVVSDDKIEFRGALINEQGVTFAVVEVLPGVLDGGESVIREERERYAPVFKGRPIVLAARGADGRARFSGRPDIVRFLIASGWSRIPWKHYRARKKDKNPFRDWG